MNRGSRLVLLLLAPACALGTFASEVTVALASLIALAAWLRGARLRPVGGSVTFAYAAAWLLMVPVSGNLREGLGHVWPIVPLLVIPPLVAAVGLPNVRPGLWAAAGVGVWGAFQGLVGEASGPFSHHLTLAYALLPPLGVALQRRSALSIPMVLGILGARSAGAMVAVCVTVGLGLAAAFDAARGRSAGPLRAPRAALGGLVLTVLGLSFADRGEVGERAILWTGGLLSGFRAPSGPGGYPHATAPLYDALQPGFWFPNHAHDSATQLLAVLGPAGWLCGLLLIVALFEGFGAGAAAGLAGVCIGSLTQDAFGDLEVVRAVVVWGCLTLDLRPVRSTPG